MGQQRYSIRVVAPDMQGRKLSMEYATKKQIMSWLFDLLDNERVGRSYEIFTVEWFSRENVQ